MIVQISDLHVTTPGRNVVPGVDTAALAAAAVQRIRALDEAPDAVIVTGDLVDEVLPAEYAEAARILAMIDAPVYLVPGNHDDRAMIRSALAGHGYLPPEGRFHYTVEGYPVRLLALDTLVDGQVHGTLGRDGLDWLDARLSEQPDRPTLVFMHHPPFVTHLPVMDGWRLTDGPAMEAVVARHRHVLRVVAGHVHRFVVAPFGGTIAMTAPPLCHAIALGPGDERGFPFYTLESPGMLLHRWDGERLTTQLAQTTGDWEPRRF
nr:phosphodiesterase [Chthonobacter albigriseus]